MQIDLRDGLKVESVEEAKTFLHEVVRQVRTDPGGCIARGSGDYDVFLPWLWELTENSPHRGEALRARPQLEQVYMDAAWALVMDGYLRPGPRKIHAQTRPSDFGVAYSLTVAGQKWAGVEERERVAA